MACGSGRANHEAAFPPCELSNHGLRLQSLNSPVIPAISNSQLLAAVFFFFLPLSAFLSERSLFQVHVDENPAARATISKRVRSPYEPATSHQLQP